MSFSKYCILFLIPAFILLTIPAKSWDISSTVLVTRDSMVTESIFILAGGHLIIQQGVTLRLTAGFGIEVLPNGTLTAHEHATIYVANGVFTTYTSATSVFNYNASLLFDRDGICNFYGGTCSFTQGHISATSPTYDHTINISDGNTLQGSVRITDFDDINLITNNWHINSNSSIAFAGTGSFEDPTLSNSHTIEVDGTLTFSSGTFRINDNQQTRIPAINLSTYGRLVFESASVFALPDIAGIFYSQINTVDSYCFFEAGAGISTQGFIDAETTEFSAFTPTNGWDGILLYSDPARLNMYSCRVKHANTTTGAFAIKIDGADYYTHAIAFSTIYSPTSPNNGSGILIEGPTTGTTTCTIQCTYVEHFEQGINISHGNVDILNSVCTLNGIGCYIHDDCYVSIEGSLFSENSSSGLDVTNNSLCQFNNSEASNNTSTQITATNYSELLGSHNNIFNPTPGSILALAYNNSLIELPLCYWLYTPPIPGIHLIEDPSSNIVYSNWVKGPFDIGYVDCGINYPKSIAPSIRNHTPNPQSIAVNSYPNPFNPTAKIEYTLPESSHITIKVYTLDGAEVALLYDGFQTKGTHTTIFTPNTNVSSGVYIYRLTTSDFTKQGTMIFMK